MGLKKMGRPSGWLLAIVAAVWLTPDGAAGQQVLSQAERTITVAQGASALLTRPTTLERVSIADEGIATATVLSPREILINGVGVGTTSLLVWAEGDVVRLYNIEVQADVQALQRQIDTLYPDHDIVVTTAGNTLIVSGVVRDPVVVRRTMELANNTGAQVVNNLQAPAPEQILLHVEFAEVDRQVVKRFSSDLLFLNPQNYDNLGSDDLWSIETLSEGIVNFTVLGDDAAFDAFLTALKTTGQFKNLAEPNLIALEGQEATFLAGGEFPYPAIQSGGGGAVASNAVTVQFREFGIRLRFTPNVTNTGNVRLSVAPEVSTLDFGTGLTFGGFQVPSLITRRVETEVELRPGQHLAIAGLIDNGWQTTVDKIPVLGDIPIIGVFFRSQAARQRQTELLVLITPHIVEPSDVKPALPTGEPETWNWDGQMREMQSDTVQQR
jgi:pilus assembly protein CpaC